DNPCICRRTGSVSGKLDSASVAAMLCNCWSICDSARCVAKKGLVTLTAMIAAAGTSAHGRRILLRRGKRIANAEGGTRKAEKAAHYVIIGAVCSARNLILSEWRLVAAGNWCILDLTVISAFRLPNSAFRHALHRHSRSR